MKTSSQKLTSNFTWGRYILIVVAALLLAFMLYTVLDLSDWRGESQTQTETPAPNGTTTGTLIGVEPSSFQEISEFRDESNLQRLRLSGKAEAGAVVVITNLGERLRQVRVNDLGQWGVTLDVEPRPMALETHLYIGEDAPAIRSEETIFRIPVPESEADVETMPEDLFQTELAPSANYKTSALIMVTAPGSPSRIVQSPFGDMPRSGPLSLSVIDYDFSGGVIITGMSSVPGRVRLTAQDAVIGETGIGVGGRWNFIASRLLPRARFRIRAELIPASGAPNAPSEPISISVPFNFIPPLQEEDTDGSGALSLNVDASQWQVRRTLIGGGGQTTIIFSPEISK